MSKDLLILLFGVPGLTSRGYLGYCTVVLFRFDNTWALFDTGHFSDRHLLLKALKEKGVEPHEIKSVVLSHLHFDHVLNLPLFKEAEVYVSQAELDHAEHVSAGKSTDPVIPDFWPFLLEGRMVHIIREALVLSRDLELIHLPGHTPGSLAMVHSGERIMALCGDVIKNAWEAVTGKAGMALAGDAAASESIRKIMEKAEVIIPGHDRPFRRRKEGLEFLHPFKWEVQASLYPDEVDKTVLQLDVPAGLVSY